MKTTMKYNVPSINYSYIPLQLNQCYQLLSEDLNYISYIENKYDLDNQNKFKKSTLYNDWQLIDTKNDFRKQFSNLIQKFDNKINSLENRPSSQIACLYVSRSQFIKLQQKYQFLKQFIINFDGNFQNNNTIQQNYLKDDLDLEKTINVLKLKLLPFRDLQLVKNQLTKYQQKILQYQKVFSNFNDINQLQKLIQQYRNQNQIDNQILQNINKIIYTYKQNQHYQYILSKYQSVIDDINFQSQFQPINLQNSLKIINSIQSQSINGINSKDVYNKSKQLLNGLILTLKRSKNRVFIETSTLQTDKLNKLVIKQKSNFACSVLKIFSWILVTNFSPQKIQALQDLITQEAILNISARYYMDQLKENAQKIKKQKQLNTKISKLYVFQGNSVQDCLLMLNNLENGQLKRKLKNQFSRQLLYKIFSSVYQQSSYRQHDSRILIKQVMQKYKPIIGQQVYRGLNDIILTKQLQYNALITMSKKLSQILLKLNNNKQLKALKQNIDPNGRQFYIQLVSKADKIDKYILRNNNKLSQLQYKQQHKRQQQQIKKQQNKSNKNNYLKKQQNKRNNNKNNNNQLNITNKQQKKLNNQQKNQSHQSNNKYQQQSIKHNDNNNQQFNINNQSNNNTNNYQQNNKLLNKSITLYNVKSIESYPNRPHIYQTVTINDQIIDIKSLQNKYQKNIKSLKNKYQKNIKSLKNKYQKKIAQFTNVVRQNYKLSEELKMYTKQSQTKIRQLNDEIILIAVKIKSLNATITQKDKQITNLKNNNFQSTQLKKSKSQHPQFVSTLKQLIKDLQDQLSNKNLLLASKDQKLVNCKKSLDANDQFIKQKQNMVSSLKNQKQTLQNTINSLNSKLSNYEYVKLPQQQNKLKAQQKYIAQLQKQIQKKNQLLTQIQTIHILQAKSSSLQDSISQQKNNLKNKQTSDNLLKAQNNTLDLQIKQLKKQNNQLKVQNQTFQTRINQLQINISTLNYQSSFQKTQFNTKLYNLNESLQKEKQQNDSNKQKIQKYELQINQKSQQFTKLQNDFNQAVKSQKQQIQLKSNTISSLQTKITQLNNQLIKLKQQMGEKKKVPAFRSMRLQQKNQRQPSKAKGGYIGALTRQTSQKLANNDQSKNKDYQITTNNSQNKQKKQLQQVNSKLKKLQQEKNKQIQDLNNKIKELDASNKQLLNTNQLNTNQLSNRNSQIKTLKQKQASLNAKYKQLEDKYKLTVQKIQTIKEQNLRNQEDDKVIQQKNELLTNLNSQVQQLRSKLKEKENTQKKLKQENQKYQLQIQNINDSKKTLQNQIKQSFVQLNPLQTQNQYLKTQLTNLKSLNQQNQIKFIQEKQTIVEDYENICLKLQIQVRDARTAFDFLTGVPPSLLSNNWKQINKEKQQVKQVENIELNTKITGLESQIIKLNELLKQANQKVEPLEEIKNIYQSKIQEQEAKINALNTQKDTLRKTMKTQKQQAQNIKKQAQEQIKKCKLDNVKTLDEMKKQNSSLKYKIAIMEKSGGSDQRFGSDAQTSQLKMQNQKIKKDLQSMRKSLQLKDKQIKQIKDQIQTFTKQIKEKNSHINKLQLEVKAHSKSFQYHAVELISLKEQLNKSSRHFNELSMSRSKQIKSLNDRIISLQSECVCKQIQGILMSKKMRKNNRVIKEQNNNFDQKRVNIYNNKQSKQSKQYLLNNDNDKSVQQQQQVTKQCKYNNRDKQQVNNEQVKKQQINKIDKNNNNNNNKLQNNNKQQNKEKNKNQYYSSSIWDDDNYIQDNINDL